MSRTPLRESPVGRAAGIFACLLLASTAPQAGAEHADMHGDHGAASAEAPLGSVDFRVSCAEETRPAFDRALASLHHMMYEQARSAFERIAEDEPGCAMAHWGIATTLFQPFWATYPSPEELARGWASIQEARALGPATERERRLVAATEAFFRDPESATYRTRIGRWADAMEEAHRAVPEDLDTAALYALSRLTLAQRAEGAEERDRLHDEAEVVLRRVYEQVPTHPGAVHYTIHAVDIDGRAGRSLDIVRSYGEIAPDTPHALHMPSHIHVRLGDWPEVIAWNRRSADAALRYPAGDAVSHHFIHAMDYLLYALLQRGEDERASAVLEEALSQGEHQRTSISAFHHAAMPARHAVERRQWAEAKGLEPRAPSYLPWDDVPWAEGSTWLARGLGAIHEGDLAAAREAQARLDVLRDALVAAGDPHIANYVEIDRLILAGFVVRAENEPDRALDRIRKAAELEGTVEKSPITPGALLPPYEALGDLLLELDRPTEALAAYRASNEVWPRRFNTVLGTARAAAAADDREGARRAYAELLEIAGGSNRPALSEAREYLGR